MNLLLPEGALLSLLSAGQHVNAFPVQENRRRMALRSNVPRPSGSREARCVGRSTKATAGDSEVRTISCRPSLSAVQEEIQAWKSK